MLTAHGQKIGALIASAGAIAGSWMETAQSHLGFVVLCLSALTAIVVLINGILTMCHAVHQRNKDLREERDQIAAEKRRLENAVCDERRRTGACPRSTFKLPHHGEEV